SYETKFSPKTIYKVAGMLAAGKVIGVCNGFGEAGPRALGNRSILARADSKSLANKISMEKKGREWYRPLAPVALEKNTRYFTGVDEIHPLSEFMLIDFSVLSDRQKELAGAVHADGTARVQTIFKKQQNPFLFDLLELLDVKYGIKALINTSFNGKGEPIVHAKENALTAARNMKLDGVILNGEVVKIS
ncbi:MAG TPA: carbamoyltransferase C-terminal domain-containing protein, partial [Tangfeifania sp.]|nr:carbamoyltransferase C-terminal domain-containing protein [Tangfeifania sp.]